MKKKRLTKVLVKKGGAQCVFFSILLMTGCGYGFRTSQFQNPWKGVRHLYVPVFKNKSMGTGAEITLTDAFIKEVNSTGKWKIVGSREKADAEVLGIVLDSSSLIASKTSAGNLPGCETVDPSGVTCPDEEPAGGSKTLVVDQYTANLMVQMDVVKIENSDVLYSKIFRRSENYSASNRKGAGGSTNTLINDSREKTLFETMSGSLMNEAVLMMVQAF